MLKSVLLGSTTALAVSAVALTSVSLLLPTPERLARPDTSAPAAPVLRDQAERAPRVPERPGEVAADPVAPASAGAGAATPAGGPVEQASATAVDLPLDSQFNRPPEDGVAVTPGADTPPEDAQVREGLAGVPGDIVAPAPQTESAAQPQPAQISGFGTAPVGEEAPEVPGATDESAPVTFGTVVEPDTSADPSPEPGITTDAATPAAPAAVAADDASLLRVPADEPTPETGPAPRRLVLDSAAGAATGAAEGETGVPVAGAQATRPRALDTFAASFSNPGNLPLVSVVLIDNPALGVSRESLAGIDFPMTFAIDPSRPDAGEAAAAYRAAGHEVVVLADALPQTGTPQDMEVAMSAILRAVPEAVALLDRRGSPILSDRAALAAILPTLEEAGMGLLGYPAGLNSGLATAEQAQVPATVLYRVLDEDDERATVLTRYLDRSTFEAEQSGATVVVGQTSADMVTALYSWQLGSRSERVAAAPLSAVLEAAAEP